MGRLLEGTGHMEQHPMGNEWAKRAGQEEHPRHEPGDVAWALACLMDAIDKHSNPSKQAVLDAEQAFLDALHAAFDEKGGE
jgi:hypothetical protein